MGPIWDPPGPIYFNVTQMALKQSFVGNHEAFFFLFTSFTTLDSFYLIQRRKLFNGMTTNIDGDEINQNAENRIGWSEKKHFSNYLTTNFIA